MLDNPNFVPKYTANFLNPRFGSNILGVNIFNKFFNMINDIKIPPNHSKGCYFYRPTLHNEVSCVAHTRLELVLALCLLPFFLKKEEKKRSLT